MSYERQDRVREDREAAAEAEGQAWSDWCFDNNIPEEDSGPEHRRVRDAWLKLNEALNGYNDVLMAEAMAENRRAQ